MGLGKGRSLQYCAHQAIDLLMMHSLSNSNQVVVWVRVGYVALWQYGQIEKMDVQNFVSVDAVQRM